MLRRPREHGRGNRHRQTSASPDDQLRFWCAELEGELDDDFLAFVGARGFTLESPDTTSAVDPRTLPEPPRTPAGIAVIPMAEYANDPTPVYEADRESALDEPGPSDFSGATYESWHRPSWETPDCDHGLSVAAVADGVVVGTSFLYSDRETGRA